MAEKRFRARRFADRAELARELAGSIAGDLGSAVAERGAASLVVSGGSTPRPLFEELARRPVDWSRLWLTLADERWVAADDEASNEALVRRHLLVGEAAAAHCIGLKTAADTPEAGRTECEERLREMPRPFDVVILGMGADGHTASLFPEAAELADGLDLGTERSCLAVRPPGAPHARMSLTLAALLDSRRIVLHVTGEDKWATYLRALLPGSVEKMPVRAVLRRAAWPVEVWWAP